jgi:hypothetical protein
MCRVALSRFDGLHRKEACKHTNTHTDHAHTCMPPQALSEPVPKSIDYELVVQTGNKLGAGTDATVTAEIVGSLYTAQHTFDQVRKRGVLLSVCVCVGGWVGVGCDCCVHACCILD